jgi:hypothetical protein
MDMKAAALVAAMIILPLTACAGLHGSIVELVEPADPVEPGVTYEFLFRVLNGSASGESVVEIQLMHPWDLERVPGTMGYHEIEFGRPFFLMVTAGNALLWLDQGSGGIHGLEETLVWADFLVSSEVAQGQSLCFQWYLEGDWGSLVSGSTCGYTPVERASWTRIKRLFR